MIAGADYPLPFTFVTWTLKLFSKGLNLETEESDMLAMIVCGGGISAVAEF